MSDVDERRLKVLELGADGIPLRDIERELGVNRGTASKWIRRDLGAFLAARRLEADAGDDELGDLGTLIEGLDGGDVLTRARARVVGRLVSLLRDITFDKGTSLRERLRAAEHLQGWLESSPSVEDQIPPLPNIPPTGPAAFPCGVCVECTDCEGARWAAWQARVVWARALPMATDRSAVRAGGALVAVEDVAKWLTQGGEDLAAGIESPAGLFAAAFTNAAGESIARLLAEHAEAITRGDASAAQATQRALEKLLPKDYEDPQPLSLRKRESDTARFLRLCAERFDGLR